MLKTPKRDYEEAIQVGRSVVSAERLHAQSYQLFT